MKELNMVGPLGYYVDDNAVISFQTGGPLQESEEFPVLPYASANRWLNVGGYNVYARGLANRQCEEIERDFKHNRLLPRLISKQVNMLYGKGPAIYLPVREDNKLIRRWIDEPRIQGWLESWGDKGLEMGYKDFGLSVIKRYYYFRDFFVKWRFSLGAAVERMPVSGLELLENKNCRLATKNPNVATDLITYSDLRYVVSGNWDYGVPSYKIYPRFQLKDLSTYRFACISHHRESSVGDHYGCNETHEGTKQWIKGANESPEFINSFLRNSLAAKVHVIIPNAWVDSKRKQIDAMCRENKLRVSKGLTALKYNGIEIGDTFLESHIIQYMRIELQRLSTYLSGKNNQGKAYASVSFMAGDKEQVWKIETVDLKYKEYISSLIEYDKRADEVLLSAVGLDASISSVSKEGVISKSGADAYYNYLIYLMSLAPDDEKCSEPFNDAIRVNFPDLWAKGYRIGYYREVPARQEDTSTNDRLKNQKQ